MIGPAWRSAAEGGAWLLALLWCVRTRALVQRIGDLPDLSEVQWDLCPSRAPGLIAVVPVRDEAERLAPALETLLAQDYPWLRTILVDDRSTDGTGALLDEFAAAYPAQLGAVHLQDVPEGWLAKSFALEVVTAQSRSEYLLFTEADVWFSPSILRRALAYAEQTGADHLVVAPTPVTANWRERAFLAFLQQVELWLSRPWRVSDARARWDTASAGAFQLVRREAWEQIGGWSPQRMAVAETTLGRRMRAAGLRQRLAFAPGLVLQHRAPGLLGRVRGLSKSLFAAVDFRVSLLALAAGALLVLFFGPLAGLAWWPTLMPSLLSLVCIAVSFRALGEGNDLRARFGWLYPLAALTLFWAMLRSAVLVLWRRGVLWRGTFYPLRELRRQNNPFTWEWQAVQERATQRKDRRAARPSRWVQFARRLQSQRANPARRRPRMRR